MHDTTLIFLYHMYLNNSGNQPGYLFKKQLLCSKDYLLYDNIYLWIYRLCPEKRCKHLLDFHINIFIQFFLLLLLYLNVFKLLFILRQIVAKVCIQLIILFIFFFIFFFIYLFWPSSRFASYSF